MKREAIVCVFCLLPIRLAICRKCVGVWQAHEGVIRGTTFTPSGEQLLTCADDKTIKTWSTESFSDTPLDTVVCKYMVTGISHARDSDQFATCGENTQLWAAGRTVPLRYAGGGGGGAT
jgi:WD40 repeat protein